MIRNSTIRKLKTPLSALICLIAAVAVVLKLYTDCLVDQAEVRYPPQGQFIFVKGSQLHYVSKGTGRPVVLIHGDGGSTYDWTLSTFNRVARKYQAIAFDRPGFGYSERPLDSASPSVQAHFIHAAVKELSTEKPVLVGHSRGGIIAAAYALHYPEDVAGVVTLGAGFFYKDRWAPLPNNLLLLPVLGDVLANTVSVPFGRTFVEAGLQQAFSPEQSTPADYLNVFVALLLRPRQIKALVDDQANAAKDMKRIIPRYGEIEVPFIIVNGQRDASVPIDHARKFAQILPNDELIELPNAGHEIMFTQPEKVMKAITMAFAQIDAQAGRSLH